jgi:hypothetical protein
MTRENYKMTELCVEYKTLSQVNEQFGRKPSTHKVAIFVNKRMEEILKEIETLNKKIKILDKI